MGRPFKGMWLEELSGYRLKELGFKVSGRELNSHHAVWALYFGKDIEESSIVYGQTPDEAFKNAMKT